MVFTRPASDDMEADPLNRAQPPRQASLLEGYPQRCTSDVMHRCSWRAEDKLRELRAATDFDTSRGAAHHEVCEEMATEGILYMQVHPTRAEVGCTCEKP